ncbi:MAG: exo-alpha-sialidase [Candidatus Competibacteraceae bacterium]|nr:exo-alpha-sialidase [Candidatus Competibacteraceae bacterium]
MIYLRKHLKSVDGGKTVEPQNAIDVEDINAVPERAVFSKKGMFYALGGRAKLVSPGVYSLDAWRSTDDLKTVRPEKITLNIPEGPAKEPEEGVWYGIYVFRTILELPDGSWLMTMYGNFAEDNLPIHNRNAKEETRFMMRSFVVRSTDQGKTWNYLSSIAVPKSGDPIGEGFVEPAIALLDNGQLLSILRTGHHFPLYASWSADWGKTWSSPVYTGLDRGVDPNLIRLGDGRVALGWGRRYREGWSKITPEGDQFYFKYPGEGDSNLAISEDGGQTWVNHKIARKTGSTYSTIFEVEPNVIFYQVDQWIGRITLKPR